MTIIIVIKIYMTNRFTFLPILYIGLFGVFDPITFDFLVTALPLIAVDLNASPAQLAGLFSYYLLGVGFAQLWSGEFVDRYGQRIAVRIGAVAFLVFSACVALSQDLRLWHFARFATGMAVGLCITASLASVREKFVGQSGRVLGIIYGAGNVMGIISPLIAGILISQHGWPSVLWAIAAWGVLLCCTAFVFYPKSSSTPQTAAFSFAGWLDAYRAILQLQPFVIGAFVSALAYGCFICFIAASSYVLSEGYGVSGAPYGYLYSFIIAVFVIGSLAAQYIKPDKKLFPILRLSGIFLAAASAMIIWNALHWRDLNILVMMIAVMSFMTAILIPQGMGIALTPFDGNKGKASAGIIIAHVIAASAAGWGATFWPDSYGFAIGCAMLAQAVLLLALLYAPQKNSQPLPAN